MTLSMKFLNSLLLALVFILPLKAGETVIADPDSLSSGLEFYGVPSAKIGDYVSLRHFSFGGFLESRNEKRFNQGVLPNHNWRGYAMIMYGHDMLEREDMQINLSGGYEHESAHPTMGFHENNDSAYEMIYDDLYRNINLNSVTLRGRFQWNTVVTLIFILDYQFYFSSKNTPELHNTDLSQSHGISAGLDVLYPVSENWTVFMSIFNRTIFQGYAHRVDNIYYDQAGSVVTRNESYPIINNVNSIVVKTGVLWSWELAGRSLGIYGKVLYGNIFGFVDSRERRLNFYGGVELFH